MSADSPVAILYNSGGTEVATPANPLRTDPTGTTAQPVSGSVGVNNFPATQAVTGPLTDAQLRATAVPVSGPLTDTQLRATPVPVSAASLPLPTGAATSANQTNGTQKAQPVDAAGVNLATADGATPAATTGLMVEGFYATTGKAYRMAVDAQGRLVTAPPGTTGTTKGFCDGQATLAAKAIVPLRKTTYTEPTANAQRSISSASANDSSAGTGARQVRITYFDTTGAGPFTETVTLNGTTAVNTVATNIRFIEKLEVVSVGSTGSNVGIITLFGATGGGGGAVWSIAATDNKTFGAHHYVAASQKCNITGLLIGIKGADTTSGFLRSKDPTIVTSPEVQISDLLRAPSAGQSFRSYGTPIVVVGPARITAFAAPDSTSSRTYYGSFDFYEEAV